MSQQNEMPPAADSPKTHVRAPKAMHMLPRGSLYRRAEAQRKMPVILLVAIVAFAGTIVTAFIVDLNRVKGDGGRARPSSLPLPELSNQVATASALFRDPKGRFTITLPEGWSPEAPTADGSYDAGLYGPNMLSVEVRVSDLPDWTPAQLKSRIQYIDYDNGIDSHLEEREFLGAPAFFRSCQMKQRAFVALDFLRGGRAYHVIGTMPTEQFDAYRPILEQLAASIRPL